MKKLLLCFALSACAFHDAVAQNLFSTTTNSYVNSTAATHSLTFGSASTGIALYKTPDQTGSYERLIAQWQGNAFTIGSYFAGSGTQGRSIQIGVMPTSGTTTLALGRVFSVNSGAGTAAGFFDFYNSTSVPGSMVTLNTHISGSSVQQNMLAIQGTVDQPAISTSGYRALFISPYINNTGSGIKYLIDAGTNSASGASGTHTSKFVLTQGGNVGIGTASPVSALTLGGTGNANPNTGSEVDYAGENLTFLSQAPGQAFTIGGIKMVQPTGYYIDRGDMIFSSAGDGGFLERMRINASGNVGIGIKNAQNKLDVNGTIHSQKVVIDLIGWNDYVFDKGYKLPSLPEVKAFIDKNHHLPEIPSEKEMVKNGLDVSEMNKLLMKKVEELTLYMIEKDQNQKQQLLQMQKQQRQINLLNKKLNRLVEAK